MQNTICVKSSELKADLCPITDIKLVNKDDVESFTQNYSEEFSRLGFTPQYIQANIIKENGEIVKQSKEDEEE